MWVAAERVAQAALKRGSLLPIATSPRAVEQGGGSFQLHVRTANADKKPLPSSPHNPNPFLPYDPAMYVADVGEQHVCLLNKFPVLSPHLLICSREFIAQITPLTLSDFTAWVAGLESEDTLGFYNSGPGAGASQMHRHMQLVKSDVPLRNWILRGELPFVHRLTLFETLEADQLLLDYQAGLDDMNLIEDNSCKPYNLLLTRQWMLMIPRSTIGVQGVLANGLNYAGHFLIKNEEQGAWLAEYGFLKFLADCAFDCKSP